MSPLSHDVHTAQFTNLYVRGIAMYCIQYIYTCYIYYVEFVYFNINHFLHLWLLCGIWLSNGREWKPTDFALNSEGTQISFFFRICLPKIKVHCEQVACYGKLSGVVMYVTVIYVGLYELWITENVRICKFNLMPSLLAHVLWPRRWKYASNRNSCMVV